VKLIAQPKWQVARAGLLACVLAATTLYALTLVVAAVHRPTSARNIPQRTIGTATTSAKTIVNLRDLAAARGKTTGGHTLADTRAAAAAFRPGSKPTAQLAAAVRIDAAAAAAPTVDRSFPGLAQIDGLDPPDPNAAAGLTQIVEVVNLRLAVYTRSGVLDSCGSVPLGYFFGAFEELTDPRVIYDNVANKFTVIATVKRQQPSGPGPHLPGFPIIWVAHSLTSNACGAWSNYYLSNISLNNNDIGDGDIIDQPTIGQDRNAFLFGGLEQDAGFHSVRYVAFAEPKSCAYGDLPGCTVPIFSTAHYATPASAGGNPMITTGASYFVASVPDVGYELYRMDNAGDPARARLMYVATPGLATSVRSLTRDAAQPDTASPIDLGAGNSISTRITSTPTFDGTRIWFAHTTSVSNHPVVRYGAINTNFFTETDALALHSATSDDFNPSIAVGLNGTSTTIFLNWAYTDVPAGIPVTAAVATVTVSIGSTDPPLPIINGTDTKLIVGGITASHRFGDYSSTMIDPLNTNQVCAVTAQEFFARTDGRWITNISRFGAPGC
jgi:hypothetical protein